MVLVDESIDPLAVVTAPPPNETPEEKKAREESEAKAQRISDQIDGQLCSEKAALKEQNQIVKVLLVGQSGDSGKIALLRHLLLQFARDQWTQERASWKIVLRIKLVHSVNTILEALQAALNDEGDDVLPFADKHHRLRLRLRPLRGVESYLKRLLNVKAEDTVQRSPNTLFKPSPNAAFEFYDQFCNWRNSRQDPGASRVDSAESSCWPIKHDGLSGQDATEVLWSCKNYILALWTDPVVREMVQRYRVRVDDSASFCLDNSERLIARNYEPTDDDIIYARLCTPGVREHELKVTESERSQTWKFYDWGGSRTQRHAWLPYFDQVNTIVFLVPISRFDEQLQEDPSVSRLEDALILWKAVCSSAFLARANLLLLFHNTDVLANKIANGVTVKQYILSYGDRPNDTQSVVKYIREKCRDTLKNSSPTSRPCHIHSVSTIDAHTTTLVVNAVREGIIREHLTSASLL